MLREDVSRTPIRKPEMVSHSPLRLMKKTKFNEHIRKVTCRSIEANHSNWNLTFNITKPKGVYSSFTKSSLNKELRTVKEACPPLLIQQSTELKDNLETFLNECRMLGPSPFVEEKKEPEIEQPTRRHADKYLLELGGNMFEILAVEDKHYSLRIQKYLTVCSVQALDYVASLAQDCLETLIYSNFGCYVLMGLCSRSREFSDQIEGWALAHFSEFVVDQYATRILQTLAEVSFTFRLEARDLFLKDWATLILRTPASFFLIGLIKNADSWIEIEPIFKQLTEKPEDFFHFKRYKKAALELANSPVYPFKSNLFETMVKPSNSGDIF